VNSWIQKDARIDEVITYANDRLKAGQKIEIIEFIKNLYQNASPEDLTSQPVDELYAAALSLWKFGEQRDKDAIKIRVFNPTLEEHGWQSSHSVIQVIVQDMPFLLDSITANLLEAGMDIYLLVHPIMETKRNQKGVISENGPAVSESVMHIEITALMDNQQLNDLQNKILQMIDFIVASIEDWPLMLKKIDETVQNLDLAPKATRKSEISEAQAFLKWLKANNFTLLGYREYNHKGKGTDTDIGFGILRNPDVHVLRGPKGLVSISPEITDFMERPEVMMISKANVKSMIHRVVHLDYIGFKQYDKKGKVLREIRFIGLFTSDSYNQRAQEIPYLERKVKYIIKKSLFPKNSHDEKALYHILETLPRDELFQVDEETLFEMAMGILHLNIRPKARAFIRKDRFERFVSALIFVPKELYDSALREKVEALLCKAYNGEVSSRYAKLTNERIARWHFIIRTKPGKVPNPESSEINRQLIEVAQRWTDYLQEVLNDRHGEALGMRLFQKYSKSFSSAYKEKFDPRFAVIDIDKIEQLPDSDNIQFNFYRIAEDPDNMIRLKIYTSHQTIALSDCLPMLENLGLKVLEEFALKVRTTESGLKVRHTIHDFRLEDASGTEFHLHRLKERLETTLRQTWLGAVDNDGFNKLILRAGLDYRQTLILRAYSKYLRQLGISYSETYMQDTLTQHPKIANLLTSIFETSFALDLDVNRDKAVQKTVKTIRSLLEKVDSLDEDRMLRSYLNVITSSLRTNFYQMDDEGQHKKYLSIKIQSRNVHEAPKPRPFAEVFVYSPRVEGVHLRFGPVARGGLRWSDRREDYRTEVLGLVKAQQVKNTVIVPVGAKGGFVPKQIAADATRDAFIAEGIACYKIFISGLLDITDNLDADGVVPPKNVIRIDGDDPYLVVAADKGTATFSDIANGLAADYGFWLDDAFASGGSVGYDHKKMGITARGAWVSVQRHFREIGIDVQKDSITVAGIGDMSGDVFGNGLLCSEAVKLVAAFDHRDIFIDPAPDPKKSFDERQRLFNLERSSWEDYNKKLITKGGGVFSRKLKSIKLSPQMKELFGFEDDQTTATPNELIKAILKARVDLLWFGGIGTYVKAISESHGQVGDRANDAIRINGYELGAAAIGEGGNLGCTQLGRIEYSIKGGMMNTDAVDNSAGVDCSDNEVNIKILMSAVVKSGKITQEQRNKYLESMTDEVGDIVLRDNYLQSQAITLARASSIKELDSFVRFMADLEKRANLDRELEFLPTDEEIMERADKYPGLTRPELSVLIAYAKMSLYDKLMMSDFINDPYLEKYLFGAFPAQMGRDYPDELRSHRLGTEIIAKVICNDIVNRGGIHAIKEETGAFSADIARAAIITREVFGLDDLYVQIEQLDHTVSAIIQTLLLMDIEEFARRQTIWFLNNIDRKAPLGDVIGQYKTSIEALFALPTRIEDADNTSLLGKMSMYHEHHVPKDLAHHITNLESKMAACDIVQVAHDRKFDISEIADAYSILGGSMGFDWLRAQAEVVETSDHWDRLAVNSILGDLQDQQKTLTRAILKNIKTGDAVKYTHNWLESAQGSKDRVQKLIHDFQSSGTINVTKLGFATRQIKNAISV
jgi:glutamate dehydrogenase